MATRHLIEHGHRRIVHISGNPAHSDAIRRAEGYRAAMGEAGIEVDESMTYEGNFYGQSGILGVESLLMRGIHFSAIFAANDLTAFGAALALSRRNIRVPDEVSIIGVDDKLESSLVIPPLTTIRQPAKQIGEASASAIIDLIQDRPVKKQIFHGELVIRQSVSRVH